MFGIARERITLKVLIPVAAIFIAGMILLNLYIVSAIQENAVANSVEHATGTLKQYKLLRAYYTENVVNKVKKATSLKIKYDHKDDEQSIPLPASMIHDLSAKVNDKASGIGAHVKLYSAHPFPARKDRVLDSFAKQAIEYFQKNPDAPSFSRRESIDGQDFVRVAIHRPADWWIYRQEQEKFTSAISH